MNNTIVTYETFHGSAKKVAEVISKTLDTNLINIDTPFEAEDLKDNIARGLKNIGKKISDVIEEVKDTISHDFFDYLKEYGDYTFEEKEFNEVDNVILSMLTYVNYSGIVSEGHKEKKTIKEVSDIYFSKYTKKEINKNLWH